jgi:hypothetical protein
MVPYLLGSETANVQSSSMCIESRMIKLLLIAVSAYYFLCFRRVCVDGDRCLQNMPVTVLLVAEPLEGHTTSLPSSSDNAAHQGALLVDWVET